MTKYFCDRCNKEIPKTFSISIRTENNSSLYLYDYKSYEVCESCSNQIKKYLKNRKSEVDK